MTSYGGTVFDEGGVAGNGHDLFLRPPEESQDAIVTSRKWHDKIIEKYNDQCKSFKIAFAGRSRSKIMDIAREKRRLLLVCVYELGDIGSDYVARDVLEDELIQDMIVSQFVFWHFRKEKWQTQKLILGLPFLDDVSSCSCPMLLVIDPADDAVVWMQKEWSISHRWDPMQIAQSLSELCYDGRILGHSQGEKEEATETEIVSSA